jgi:sodium transport system permease protein
MKNIFIIFKKELKDTIRDRRTLFFMVVMPFLAIYLIFNISFKISTSQERKAQGRILNVGLISHGNAADLRSTLYSIENVKVEENIKEDSIPALLKNEQLDFALVIEENFDQNIKENKTGNVRFYLRATEEENMAKDRILNPLNDYKKRLLDTRLKKMDLDESFVNTLKIEVRDVSTIREKVGESLGGMLPYFLIIFCFLGAMYPAIDLAAGEKERGTIETLLTSPAGRGEIVIGKFLVITLAGVMTALISLGWLYLMLRQSEGIPQDKLGAIIKLIEVKSIVLMLSMLIPLCVFFAALLLSASVFARSFKEAQSIMAPLNFIVIIPVFIGIFPGIKLSMTTALIPILNVSLASKEIIAGTIRTGLLIEVYLVLIALAALGLVFCTSWFKWEDVIFRGT